MKLRSADEVAAEFMLGNGHPHFCDGDCSCTSKLAEIIQWARHQGAEAQRRRDARSRIHVAPDASGIASALATTRAARRARTVA